ncbi:MAG TPA: methyltransferase domain-containing protein [Acetobacteraceae bacterium]|nr:methyltransferase domain-containing protein [Acetobacteraceae bacterium]
MLDGVTPVHLSDRAAVEAAIGRVAARYASASRFDRGFVKGKLRGDPAVAAILGHAPFGEVADLGCGRGQLGLLLLELGLAQSVTGLDLDAAKIAKGNVAAAASPAARARFAVADLATASIPACDTVLLMDVLLLMPPEAQDALLSRAAAAARRRILIRAFDPDRGWRSACGRTIERLRLLFGADPAGCTLAPRPIGDIATPLAAAGFAVSVTPCWGATPLPNVLITAERRGA